MPLGKTRFSNSWLDTVDSNGDELKKWCTAGTNLYSFRCLFCGTKEKSCANMGKDACLQHAKSEKHRQMAVARRSQCTIGFKAQSNSSPQQIANPSRSNNKVDNVHSQSTTGTSANESKLLTYMIPRESSLTAEIIWLFNVANLNHSYRSCDGLKDTLCAMFPDSQIAQKMTLSKGKASYMISDGLGPVLMKELTNDILASGMYTLHYDEATSADGSKQLDLHMRYWSNKQNEVTVSFYKASNLGHATGEIVYDEITDGIQSEGIQLARLLTVSNDGPNVNKTVNRLINNKVTEVRGSPLIDIDTCPLHIVHNGFGQAVSVYGSQTQELALDLHSFFKGSAARKEDLRDMQATLNIEEYTFLRYVPTRWVTLAKVLQRILHQMPVITQMWTDFEKLDTRKQPQSAAYRRIGLSLKKKDVLVVQLEFIVSVSVLFEEFLVFFQKKAPLIHLLGEKMQGFLKKLMMRFLKSECIQEDLWCTNTEAANQLSDQDIVIGEKTRSAMKKLTKDEQRVQLLGMKKFYCKAVDYLKQKLPLKNKMINSAACLNPLNRKHHKSCQNIEVLARKLPNVTEDEVTYVADEWKMYEIENSPQVANPVPNQRIDHYWRDVFKILTPDMETKYPVLQKVVKTTLILPHGNSDVERGFSVNKDLIGDSRTSLGIAGINGLRLCKEAVKQHGGKPENVPLTKEMIASVGSARTSYEKRLEEERVEKERTEAERKRKSTENERREKEKVYLAEQTATIKEREVTLHEKEGVYRKQYEIGHQLVEDGTDQLTKGISDGNMQLISKAKLLIQTGKDQIDKAQKELDMIREQQRAVEEKKNRLLDDASKPCKRDSSHPSQKYTTRTYTSTETVVANKSCSKDTAQTVSKDTARRSETHKAQKSMTDTGQTTVKKSSEGVSQKSKKSAKGILPKSTKGMAEKSTKGISQKASISDAFKKPTTKRQEGDTDHVEIEKKKTKSSTKK